jgi:hypothetical protein
VDRAAVVAAASGVLVGTAVGVSVGSGVTVAVGMLVPVGMGVEVAGSRMGSTPQACSNSGSKIEPYRERFIIFTPW